MPTLSRFDIYAPVHKGLRAFMAHALVRAGRLDPFDPAETAEVTRELTELLDFCLGHAEHEDSVVHAALEARSPGVTLAIAADHERYDAEIAQLRELLRRVPGDAQAAHALYLALSTFVAHNLAHMHEEETRHNEALWATHTDAEIHALHGRILASLTPEQSRVGLRWMLPHVSAGERAGMLAHMRAGAPAEVFDGVVDMLRPLLGSRDRLKLDMALAA